MKILIKLADEIVKNNEHIELNKIRNEQKEEIKKQVEQAQDNDIDEIITHLFPLGISISTDFYNKLHRFQGIIGFASDYYNLCGYIWARAYSKIPKEQKIVFLNSLFDEKSRGVWRAIFYLPEFCSRTEIESQFASEWFYRFGNKVKDDMANYGFFNGVKNYALHFPISGLKIYEKYLDEDLDNMKINLAALLLGTIRSQAIQGHIDKTVVDRWDKILLKSSQTEKRLIYYRSLHTSFDMGILSINNLDIELSKMIKGEPEEISEAFSIIWRCLRSERVDDNFVRYSMNWLSKNASSKLPDEAKYHIVDAMWFFTMPGKQKININALEADDLLVAIQPIPENNHGTWNYFEMYLEERLKQDFIAFENILEKLVVTNPSGIVSKFQSGIFDNLKTQIYQLKKHDFVTNWLLSIDMNKREIARTILLKSESVVLPQNVVSKANEKQLELALLELIRKPMIDAKKISEYLLALEPSFRNIKPELKQKFKNEMILQAINYPGMCLEKWEEVENPSDLLKEVIISAKKYFERLNAIKDSPAVSFTFPGCKEAAEREANEFSNKVSKEAHEQSIFAKLAKNIQIIYGSKWAVTTIDGKLGQATEFNQFGHSMEFPRVEIIDPEGMALRRLQITRGIEGTMNGK
ncbi:MAG: hypothetical protein JW787_03030 [Sedimentisphaerales bacterium]|nr:hypothetical protein [Sedimentisphaerales bacterium]